MLGRFSMLFFLGLVTGNVAAQNLPAKQIAQLVHGSCTTQFNQFMRAENQRAFAYSLDTGHRQACGKHSDASLDVAIATALAKCEAKKTKQANKAPTNECRIVATNDKQVLGIEAFGLSDDDAFKRALFIGNLQAVKHYIAKGASVHTQSTEGATALFIAAASGDDDFFFELVEKGSDINHTLPDNTSALTASVYGSSPELIRYLVSKGLDINHKANEGYTPLHVAFATLDTYTIELVMQLGANPALKNDEGKSGNDIAKQWKFDLDSAKVVDLNRIDDGCTEVFNAAKYGDLQRLEQLAKAKIDINVACKYGLSSLSYARNSEKVIKRLVELGADVNHQDDDGDTPLMAAARKGALKKVQVLISLGAKKLLKDADGSTAHDYISGTDSDEIEQLLKP